MKPNFSTPPSPPNKLKPFTTLAARASASLKTHLPHRQVRHLLPLQLRHRHRHRHRELEEFMERLPLLRPAQLLHPNLHPNLRPHPALDLLLRHVDREVVELIGQRPTA